MRSNKLPPLTPTALLPENFKLLCLGRLRRLPDGHVECDGENIGIIQRYGRIWLAIPPSLATFEKIVCLTCGHEVTSTIKLDGFRCQSPENKNSWDHRIIWLWPILKTHKGLTSWFSRDHALYELMRVYENSRS